MTYLARDARGELLDIVAQAIDELALALAEFGVAYEALDEGAADRMEEMLFRPVQSAYGRAQRAYTDFAARHDLDTRAFVPGTAGAPSRVVNDVLATAVEAVEEADIVLSSLQDTMLPVEVGDPDLRTALAEVRSTLARVEERAREFARTVGR